MGIWGDGAFQFIYGITDITVVPDNTENIFFCENHPFYDGQMMMIKSSGSIPSEFESDRVYYANILDKDYFELSQYFKGNPVEFSDNGTGTVKIYFTEETHTLVKSTVDPDYKQIGSETVSPLTGYVHFNNLGSLTTFNLKYNIFDYDDPKAQYDNIRKFQYQLVRVKLHSDGEEFKDQYGNSVLYNFKITGMFKLFADDWRDQLHLRFRSAGFIDASKSLATQLTKEDIIQSDEGII